MSWRYIDGEVYANVWLTDFIVRINPTSGRVEGVDGSERFTRP